MSTRATGTKQPRVLFLLPVFLLVSCSVMLFACKSTTTETSTSKDEATLATELARGPFSSILFWTPEQQEWGYKNIPRIRPTRRIEAGAKPYPLARAVQDLSTVTYEIDGQRYTVEDYIRERRIAGFLVLRDGTIVSEQYRLGNDENSRWISFSIAKSVVSMLVGAAIQDGYIKSVDEPVTAYLPRLKGSSYDKATIKDILHMASGVAWNEDYADPQSDVARAPDPILELIDYLSKLPSQAPPGETFNYNTGETNLVGALLRSAIGNNLATYLTHRIWQPFGMESDADWLLEQEGGVEWGGCCIMATLRDYGRIGLFAMGGGVLPDGTRVLPDGWMAQSTTPSRGFDGYGYLWWLSETGSYAAIGVFGQMISIDPTHNIVIVTHSAWPAAGGRELSMHRTAMIEAVTRALIEED
jgi:CubicO group peptidase (beta-lactamase class C family)